jgi:hypothetical protein
MSEDLKALHDELNHALAANGQRTLSIADFLRALNIGMEAVLAFQQLTQPGGQATLPEVSIHGIIFELTVKRKN